jgi:hypothetical protein
VNSSKKVVKMPKSGENTKNEVKNGEFSKTGDFPKKLSKVSKKLSLPSHPTTSRSIITSHNFTHRTVNIKTFCSLSPSKPS